MAEVVDGYAVPIHRTEVDGVPCFWADLPEEFEARLHFRVGAYDETLATRGTTHLIEHLAISDTPFVPWGYSAWVTGLFTAFSIDGTPEQVVDGLAGVTARLRELPLDRVPVTRRALLAEDSRTSSARRSLRARYGARGPGLAWYPEYGVRRVPQEHLVDWAHDRFTTGNAVLVLTGPPPPGIRCRLPDGPRWPTETPEPDPGAFPRLIGTGDERWGLGYLTPTTIEETSASEILRNRIFERLHYRLGIGDEFSRSFESLGPYLGHRYLWGDFVEGYDDAVIEAVLDELHTLAEEGPTERELAPARAWARQYADELDNGRDWLDDLAEAELLDVEPLFPRWGERYAALDAEEIADALAEALPTLVVESNADIPADALGLETSPDWPLDPIEGTAFRMRPQERRPRDRLVVGPDGVSWVDEEGDTVTIRLDRLAILERDDGTRTPIDLEAGSFEIDAAEWVDGERALELIDALVPDELTVDLRVDGPEVPVFHVDDFDDERV